MKVFRVCFVCLGNICRSPTAAAVFTHLAREAGLGSRFEVGSAGVGSWVGGDPPHRNAVAVARARGIVVTGRSRRIQVADFDRFDLVLACDQEVLADLEGLCRSDADRRRLGLLRAYDPDARGVRDVPDPMGMDEEAFERTLDACAASCRGLLEKLRDGLGP